MNTFVISSTIKFLINTPIARAITWLADFALIAAKNCIYIYNVMLMKMRRVNVTSLYWHYKSTSIYERIYKNYTHWTHTSLYRSNSHLTFSFDSLLLSLVLLLLLLSFSPISHFMYRFLMRVKLVSQRGIAPLWPHTILLNVHTFFFLIFLWALIFFLSLSILTLVCLWEFHDLPNWLRAWMIFNSIMGYDISSAKKNTKKKHLKILTH